VRGYVVINRLFYVCHDQDGREGWSEWNLKRLKAPPGGVNRERETTSQILRNRCREKNAY
jgi:hypothetical protein